MNIKKAKLQIINSVKAYLAKDGYGRYLIPQRKQRPLFLMGPPGIGKTEIMSQAAEELGIGLISYSMTHHTRQSALGLPVIKHRVYDGEEFDISEYTMSEIIAAVYDMEEKTGIKNGILFLDEINCVSETLTPVMLQFLQYKVFGGHKLPDGWIVVTAGNPPEYNNSVREFDMATWDRLKRIDIEPDFEAWKEYAVLNDVHSAVLTYLEIKPHNFYKTETTVNGKSFVTARGWDDLGHVLRVYENCGIDADGELISQYLQNEKISSDFAAYYELYKKYKSDYQISGILEAKADADIKERAKKAAFDEKYSLLGLLLEAVRADAKNMIREENIHTQTLDILKSVRDKGGDAAEQIESELIKTEDKYKKLKTANSLSAESELYFKMLSALLSGYKKSAQNGGFDAVKQAFDENIKAFKEKLGGVKAHFTNMFDFCEEVFGTGSRELLILVTELAADPFTAKYISLFGCAEYHRHDKALMFYERKNEIMEEINKLGL